MGTELCPERQHWPCDIGRVWGRKCIGVRADYL